ncbi:MAG: hypothetical protein N2323_05385 [candidate division WOR-3 bacterium]|nr:hypothetical protein [candidate division WOR-3 bacterium]MCX7837372.1 hypothetical protein [candidate division WOR-3 bacterium]MDW8114013.1 hypothetical protein [candidate division WOR-3 bacterium]
MILNIIGTWLAATLTLAIFSFLYKDNPFYKLAEHIYVGVSAGFWVIYVWAFDIKPMLIDRFLTTTGIEKWILLIPAILGVLMLTRWFPKTAWISRIPLSFTIGIGAGLGVTASIQGFLIPQIGATLLPLTTINNILLVIGVISTIIYFYFSKEFKGTWKFFSRLGIIFIMIAFGASFGYTVMARISLLIGRIYFLLHNFLNIIP